MSGPLGVLLDLLFPPKCVFCGKVLDSGEDGLCARCQRDLPWLTDGDKCIACGRCLVVCHTGSRAFRGDAYKGFEAKFVAAFSARREPETFFPSGV